MIIEFAIHCFATFKEMRSIVRIYFLHSFVIFGSLLLYRKIEANMENPGNDDLLSNQ